MDQAPIGKAILNSALVSSSITIGTVLFCTLAGFAFAKLQFRGRGLLLALVIGTMMVPTQLSLIPLFMMIADLQWVNQLQAVILPTLVSAFGVFFMRQFLVSALPNELLEAGRVDGASTFRIFWSIVVPVARPAMAVLGHAHVPDRLERLLLAAHRADQRQPDGAGRAGRARLRLRPASAR